MAYPRWSERELEILRKTYPTHSKEQILRMLPNRTWAAIQAKARVIGIEPRKVEKLTEEELRVKGLRDTDIAYLAGLFDGEGTITVTLHKDRRTKKGYNLATTVSICNTCREVIELFDRLIKGKVVTVPPKGNCRTIYRVEYRNKWDIIKFLKTLLPYLWLKRREAELMIRFCESRVAHPRGRWTGEYTSQELAIAIAIYKAKLKKSSKGPQSQIRKLQDMMRVIDHGL